MAAFDYQRESNKEDLEYRGGILPHGIYKVELESFEFADNKSTRGGKVARATVKVREPLQYKGRIACYLNLNIKHPTEDVEKNGKREFDRLLVALGFEDNDPADTNDMLARDFVVRLGEEQPNPKKLDPNFRRRNRIVRYFFQDQWDDNPIGIDEHQPEPPQVPQAGGGAGRGRDERDSRRDESRDRGDSRRDDRGRDDRGGDRDRDGGSRRDDRDRGESRGRDGGSSRRSEVDERDIPFEGRGDSRRDERDNRDRDSRDDGGRRTRNEEGSESPWTREERR